MRSSDVYMTDREMARNVDLQLL